MVNQFLTRAQYDILVSKHSLIMSKLCPLVKMEWSMEGVNVIATKRVQTQHISNLRQMMRANGMEPSYTKWEGK